MIKVLREGRWNGFVHFVAVELELGNTYVAGSSEGTVSLSGTEYGHEMYLMKVNSEGDLLWNRSLESESNSQGYINNRSQTTRIE